jgi:hypothetical protein
MYKLFLWSSVNLRHTYIVWLSSCDFVFSSADQTDAQDLIEEVLISSLGWNTWYYNMSWFSYVWENAGIVL